MRRNAVSWLRLQRVQDQITRRSLLVAKLPQRLKILPRRIAAKRLVPSWLWIIVLAERQLILVAQGT
jgi:hypothetical protein